MYVVIVHHNISGWTVEIHEGLLQTGERSQQKPLWTSLQFVEIVLLQYVLYDSTSELKIAKITRKWGVLWQQASSIKE